MLIIVLLGFKSPDIQIQQQPDMATCDRHGSTLVKTEATRHHDHLMFFYCVYPNISVPSMPMLGDDYTPLTP